LLPYFLFYEDFLLKDAHEITSLFIEKKMNITGHTYDFTIIICYILLGYKKIRYFYVFRIRSNLKPLKQTILQNSVLVKIYAKWQLCYYIALNWEIIINTAL